MPVCACAWCVCVRGVCVCAGGGRLCPSVPACDCTWPAALAPACRSEFDRHRDIPPMRIQQIEHAMRKGQKQLEMLSKKEAVGVSFVPRTG